MGLFEVGKPFKEGITRYPEGVKFDISNNECSLSIYAADPTEKARQAITKDSLRYGYFKEDNVIIMLFKFGSHNWIDVPYSVHMSKNITELKEITGTEGLLLNIYIINARTGVVEDMRLVELDVRLSKMLRNDILEQRRLEYHGFNSKLDEFYSKFTTKALVSMSRVLIV